MKVINFTSLLLLFFHYARAKKYDVHYIRTDKDLGVCLYSGYQPGGKKVNISPIKAPTATLETNILATIAGFGGKGALGTMHLSKFSEQIGKIAPKLAPALGIFGVGMGVVADLMKPSPAEILEAANKAIKELTKEVNNRFVDMKGYVDQKIIEIQKDRINIEYNHMMTMYTNCINEVTKDRVVECQEDANSYIRSGYHKFMLFSSKLGSYTSSRPPSTDDIKKMELTFLPFRKYVTLDLMQLEVLANTYKDMKSSSTGKALYKKYLMELIKDTKKFIAYANSIYEWIDYTHDTLAKKQCRKTYKCGSRCIKEGRWFGHTACYAHCKCMFDPTMRSTETCEKRFTVRADGKPVYRRYVFINTNYGYEEVGKKMADTFLMRNFSNFVSQQAKDVKSYWNSEILSSIPTWKKILENAEDDLYELEGKRFQYDFEEPSGHDKKDTIPDNVKVHGTLPQNDYPLLEDKRSPRFEERYNRAFETMKHYNNSI